MAISQEITITQKAQTHFFHHDLLTNKMDDILEHSNVKNPPIVLVWWYTYRSEKYEFVSWDDDIPNIWKNNQNVPNHQLE